MATAVGGGWRGTSVARILRNTVWRGVRTFPPNVIRKEAFAVRVFAPEDQLIADDVFAAAQRILDRRRKEWGVRTRSARFMLASLLRCGRCSKLLYQKASKAGPEYYCCASRTYPRVGLGCGAPPVQRIATEKAAVDLVKRFRQDPAFLAHLVGMALKRPEPATNPAKLEQQLSRLEAKRERTVDLYTDGVIDKADLAARLRAIDEQETSLCALLPSEAPGVDARRVARQIADLLANFEDLPIEDQRRVLKSMFKSFTVQDGAIPAFTLGGFIPAQNVRPLQHSRFLLRRIAAHGCRASSTRELSGWPE